MAELERKVGRQAMEIDFLQRCLQHVEEQRKLQALTTRSCLPVPRKRNELGDPDPAGAVLRVWRRQPCRILPLAA